MRPKWAKNEDNPEPFAKEVLGLLGCSCKSILPILRPFLTCLGLFFVHISPGDIHKLPTLCVLALFGIFTSFALMCTLVITGGGGGHVYIFLKSV